MGGRTRTLNASKGVTKIVPVRANVNLVMAMKWSEKYGFEKHLGIRIGGTFD